MTTGPLTPGEDPEPSSTIDYAPDHVPYDEQFENELMERILFPGMADFASQRPVPKDEQAVYISSLPVPLNSPDRKYPSPIPGILLTHPNGYHTGGPGPSPEEVSAFAEQFIAHHDITTSRDLAKKVDEVIKQKVAEVRERLEAREEAVLKNQRVRKDIKDLEVQRQAEERVEERIRRDRERKRARG